MVALQLQSERLSLNLPCGSEGLMTSSQSLLYFISFNMHICKTAVYSTLNPQIFRSPNSLVYMCTSIILPIRHHLCSVPLVSAFLRPTIHQVYGLFLDQSISSMASKHKRRTREFRKSSSIHNSRASKQH